MGSSSRALARPTLSVTPRTLGVLPTDGDGGKHISTLTEPEIPGRRPASSQTSQLARFPASLFFNTLEKEKGGTGKEKKTAKVPPASYRTASEGDQDSISS